MCSRHLCGNAASADRHCCTYCCCGSVKRHKALATPARADRTHFHARQRRALSVRLSNTMVVNATRHSTHQLFSSARVSNVKSLGSSRIATRRIALRASLEASNVSIQPQITRRDVMSSLLAASLLLPVKPSLAEDTGTALEASAEAPVSAVMEEVPLASTSGAASQSPASPTRVRLGVCLCTTPPHSFRPLCLPARLFSPG